MKIILCIWVLFYLVTGCSADSSILKSTESKDRTTTAIENRNEIAFLPNDSEPFTGIFEEYYSNGKIKFKKNYKDGKENGLG
jgi:antitoxin component YwqK of YwqJK toxin-antitoxin module